jgi:uncharacterized DUF497 family protein
MLKFAWDEKKNKSNRQKHGIWFEEAQSVFDDKFARMFADIEHSTAEDRFILIGLSAFNNLLVVVHCFRESNSVVRIISARKVTKTEREFYEEGI